MTILFALLSICLAFVAQFYFQLPMFVQKLPLSWLIKFGWKRMLIRIIALGVFILFLSYQPAIWQIVLAGIPFFMLWLSSFFLKSNSIFKALKTTDITKNNSPYQSGVEVVGFVSSINTSICYPIYEMVSPRHIINDEIEADKIMITYCPACGSCMIFNRIVNGLELNFEVANGIYRRNMLMMDNETKSIWQQSTGECIEGKMKGTQLEFLTYQQMTTDEWLKYYPNSLFAYENENAPKAMFSQKSIANFMNKMVTQEGPPNKNSKTLPLNEKVWGLEINGISKAYPVAELKKISPINDNIGEIEIEINYNSKTKKIEGKELKSGKPLTFQFHWWIGWVEFHQNSEVWRAK
jgi:hypothetical protein